MGKTDSLPSGHKDNVYAFPIKGEEIQCMKCETKFVGEKCPVCGIPAIPIPHANVYEFPKMLRTIRICDNPDCNKNPTTDDRCPLCGKDLIMI